MDEKEKRKILISSILIIITLILVVVGTTYAFFSLQIQNSSEPTNIEITTGEQNKITLNGSLTNYHLHLKVSDMTLDNVGKSYYGTTSTSKDYEKKESDGTKELGNISVSGELNDAYECTAKINITLDGEMKDKLQANDLVLVVIKPGGNTISYDLSETLNNPNIKFNIYDSNIDPIKAYLKFTNQDTDQSDLAGKELNISINISDFACEIKELHPNVKLLLEKGEGTFKEKSGMLRFIGTNEDVTNNYICFGTTDSSKCGTNASLEDNQKYMYRIIGVTSEDDNTINLPANSLKIIKATPSSESQQWNSLYKQADCIVDGIDKCTWDDSDIKKYLNETFLPDAISKWDNGATWDSMILSHSWYNADQVGAPIASAEPISSHTTAESKIGLMYGTDHASSKGTSSYLENWLLLANGWTGNTPDMEWTMTRIGLLSGTLVRVWFLSGTGYGNTYLSDSQLFRPVFYVSPDITLTGAGTAENPFIIHSA